jgi:hypothetical protein
MTRDSASATWPPPTIVSVSTKPIGWVKRQSSPPALEAHRLRTPGPERQTLRGNQQRARPVALKCRDDLFNLFSLRPRQREQRKELHPTAKGATVLLRVHELHQLGAASGSGAFDDGVLRDPAPEVPDWPDGVTTTKVPVTPGTEPECSTTVTSVAGSPASIASSANRHGSTDWVGWAFMGPLCGRHWFEG